MARQNSRLLYFDLLKVVFILCVLFQHLPEYLGYNPLYALGIGVFVNQLGGIGVTGFVILSGFGLTNSYFHSDLRLQPKAFGLRRLWRVVPLYYLAILAWIFLVALIPPANLAAHMLLIHVFFPDYSHNPGSLWFVGMIVQCYLIFPIAILALQRGKWRWVWLIAYGIYCLGLALVIDGYYLSDTVLLYGLAFVLGMDLAIRMGEPSPNPYLSRKALYFSLLAFGVFALIYQFADWSGLTPWVTKPLTLLGEVSFFLVALNLAVRLGTQRPNLLLSSLAFASYAVFLFHRPMWTLAVLSPLWGWISRLPPAYVSLTQFSYLVLLGMPLIFLVSYWIQIANDRTLAAIRWQRNSHGVADT